MMIKESWNLIKEEIQLVKPNQKWLPQKPPPLDNYLHAKNEHINWLFPEILKIKESCNGNGGETQLAKRNQKW